MCYETSKEIRANSNVAVKTVAVITITRKRPKLLRRAIASVQAQVCSAPLRHIVIIDDCEETRMSMELAGDLPGTLSWRCIPRSAGDKSGPGRSAVIRNAGVRMVGSEWISFLDDDNEFEDNHIESLLDCARRNACRAVHAHMRVFLREGRPFVSEYNPWTRDSNKAREVYEWMVLKGIRTPGSNVFKDRTDPFDCPDPVRSVDTNEWLFARRLLLEVPFCEEYSVEDLELLRTEDDKLLEQLIQRQEPIACTGRATLKYYLGGYSNNFILNG